MPIKLLNLNLNLVDLKYELNNQGPLLLSFLIWGIVINKNYKAVV